MKQVGATRKNTTMAQNRNIKQRILAARAVVAAADDAGLLKPKAFVVLKDGADSQDIDSSIKSLVQDDIGKWKYPRWVEVVDDLPKTATGKIQRFKLRDGA